MDLGGIMLEDSLIHECSHDDEEYLPELYPVTSGTSSTLGSRFRDMMETCKASWRGDVWRSMVLKATSRSCDPPSAQILKQMLSGIKYYGCDVISSHSAPKLIVETLSERLMEVDWVVTFKVYTCLHHILRESVSESCTELIVAKRRKLFSSRFIDPRPSAAKFAPMVVTYGQYLNRLCESKLDIQYPPLKNNLNNPYANYEKEFPHLFLKQSTEKLFESIPSLATTLEVLLRVKFEDMEKAELALTSASACMLAKDFCHFWNSLTVCVETLQKHCTKCRKTSCQTLEISNRLFTNYNTLAMRAAKMVDVIQTCAPSWSPPHCSCLDLTLSLPQIK